MINSHEFKRSIILCKEEFEDCFSEWGNDYEIKIEPDVNYFGEDDHRLFIEVTVTNKYFKDWSCVFNVKDDSGDVMIEMSEDNWYHIGTEKIWQFMFFDMLGCFLYERSK